MKNAINRLDNTMNVKVDMPRLSLLALFIFCVALTVITLFNYPGRGYIYVLFSILLNTLLFFGMRKDSIFFDFFIGVFFWLGYWLKFSVRTTWKDGKFFEPVGNFDYSGSAYDHSLLVVSYGVASLLLVRVLRARFIFTYPEDAAIKGFDGLCAFYEKHRTKIWMAFVLMVLFISISNAYLGIYQRGMTPRTFLPYKLGGVYTWLLFFGATSVSALMLNAEIKLGRAIPYTLILLVLLEIFASNVSMLSRGMILNSGALLVGVYVALKMRKTSLSAGRLLPAAVILVVLVASSVVLVNYMRYQLFGGYQLADEEPVPYAEQFTTKGMRLFLDRWVGMEGAMAVSSYPELGWKLFKETWGEEYQDYGSSLYDRKISEAISEEYNAWLKENNRHFITMPGILSFFYYPGSYVFLFIAMLIVGSIGAGIEIATYKLTGSNVILCSLIAFVVAFRFVNFGYVPARSYLLFGTIAINIMLIYFLSRLLVGRYAKK